MKREGIEVLFGYPRNQLLEAAAIADIRTIIVRQERVGLHMADAVSRLTRGKKIGTFCMQHGPGAENAYGGVRRRMAIRFRCSSFPRATRDATRTCPSTST